MPISLTAHERAAPFAGDYRSALAEVQTRLERLQVSQMLHGQQALILVEGWEASGKRTALRLFSAAFDPCKVAVHCPLAAGGETGRHWLAPFWSRLPAAGETAMFLRGWYGALVDARVRGEIDDKQWARAFDEINEFEAQQTDHGTILVKLFFHLSESAHARRLRDRSEDPWKRHFLSDDVPRVLAARNARAQAWEAMFKRSNTRWAGWTVIAADDSQSANIAALSAVADALQAKVPAEPPKAAQDNGAATEKAS